MIVADANLLAYLLVPGPMTQKAELVRAKEKVWAVTPLLRYELLSVLLKYVRGSQLSQDEAARAYKRGLAMVEVSVIDRDAAEVLRMAERSECSTYDTEYVWLARELDVPMVTEDRKVLRAFPDITVSLDQFVAKT